MSRSTVLTGLALAAVAIAGPVASQDRASWVKPAAPFHVIGPVYSVGTDNLAVYLIHTKDGEILLDGGLVEVVGQIEGNIKSLGFDVKNIKILLNSHAH